MAQPMRRFIVLSACLALTTCKSGSMLRQTAEALTDAGKTQSKIDRAMELADEIANARTDDARAKYTAKYMAAAKDALTASEETIENMRRTLIQSETSRGECETKLSDVQADAGKFIWLKWLLIIGGPLSLAGAFLLGRKF